MPRFATLIAFLLVAASAQAGMQSAADSQQGLSVTQSLSSMPLAFTENQGQWDDQVKFRANAGGATMWFTETGVYYQFTRSIPGDEPQVGPVDPGYERSAEPRQYESMMIKASFVGANPNPRVIGEEMMEYTCNYFIGNDPNEWHTDVPNHQAIVLEEVYAGIDLKYYGNGKQMEYDFIVSPGVDYSRIQIEYEGAKSLSVNELGELVVETDWGVVTESPPRVYQVKNSEKLLIKGDYVILSDNTFGFSLSERFNPELTLMIDPVLSYSTYLGGSNNEIGNAITVDGDGNAYITGRTDASDFPTTSPFQTHQSGLDAFVTKINSDGSLLMYSTYLGGSGLDAAFAIAVDNLKNAYVTGMTGSDDFPTMNPYQPVRGGSYGHDAFVIKLNSDGNDLVYSTFLGGSDFDYGQDIAVDVVGCAFVAGWTYSTDFPTMNPLQTDQGSTDLFVSKMSSEGNELVYSTYLGGSDFEQGAGIAVDDIGNAYVTGSTSSADFLTMNPYQTHQGGRDVVLVKLNSAGNGLIYSTYLGGAANDLGTDVSVDDFYNTYVCGDAYSSDFPLENPLQGTMKGTMDGFIAKFGNMGDVLIYSTYLGGSAHDYPTCIDVDNIGRAFVIGTTQSTDFPISSNALQTNQPDFDAFVTGLTSNGNGFIFSTYLGGSGADQGKGVKVDAIGNVYMTGNTWSSDFPITEEAFDTDIAESDAYIVKFPVSTCCQIRVGDANGMGGDEPTIGDASVMIDARFITGDCVGPDLQNPILPCLAEADVNQSGELYPSCNDITIGDISTLIDYLFITGPELGLAECL